MLLQGTVDQLNVHFRGKADFELITFEGVEKFLTQEHIQFLHDRRVTYSPFSGKDPGDRVVIDVRLESGFLVEAGHLTATKGEITRMPE